VVFDIEISRYGFLKEYASFISHGRAITLNKKMGF